ncbi:MAG: lysylphosphatidylglycerol synthase transmembrane domain-containing protein [Solirubrobacterales bacterium]
MSGGGPRFDQIRGRSVEQLGEAEQAGDDPSRRSRTRRRVGLGLALAASAIAALYLLLPAVAGLENTWNRISEGNPWWLSVAAALEVFSYASYMLLFQTVFGAAARPIAWGEAARITMAGVAASRLLAVAGAGGIALTAWALRRRIGMPHRLVAARMSAFFLLLYGVYMAALGISGLGLRIGVFSGPAPFGLTVVPSSFGFAVIGITLLVAAASRDLDSALERFRDAGHRLSRLWRGIATIPATISSGVAFAMDLVRGRRLGVLGAVGWWAFDVGVLWACLNAFGSAPSLAVVVTAYFVGMAANTLPVPGGIGTVDAGMIGALIGFGVDGGLAIVGVLSYRAFAFWLPIVPGAIAYVQLLRSEPVRNDAPGIG